MSNPIRIAPGPPTEEGDYKCRPRAERKYKVCTIATDIDGDLVVMLVNGLRMKLKHCAGWQFSEPIPDPEDE